MAKIDSPQPQAMKERPEKPSYASIPNPLTCIQKSDGKLPIKLKPMTYVHGEPTVSLSFSDLELYIQEENLKYTFVPKFSYGRPDMIVSDWFLHDTSKSNKIAIWDYWTIVMFW